MPDTPTPSIAPTPSTTGEPDWLHGDRRPRWRRPSTWITAAVVLLAGTGLWIWQGQRQRNEAPRFLSEPLVRGDLSLTVTANGTLQPTRSVSIGSELSGTVAKVLVDVNDRVTTGQVLVQLDTAKLEDQITVARAAVQSAKANVFQAQATQQEAMLGLARLEQVAKLSNGQMPAATDLDTARATLDRARAALASAEAAVTEAEANLSTNQTNLAKASIRSPINGVILTRAVEPGNAVAASLQAVTLFTMAEDLSHMRLSVNVDEADVGQVQAGQQAQFTVSAWPSRKYPATITRVAYGSTTTDNVVTYTTLLDVANPDMSLRPGMTATATIAATEHKGVWLVPRAALNFTPTGTPPVAGAEGAAAPRSSPGGSGGPGILGMLMPRPPGGGGANGANGAQTGTRKPLPGGSRRIWVMPVDGAGPPQPVDVKVGLSNGRLTEVSGDGLRDGLMVITEQQGGTAP